MTSKSYDYSLSRNLAVVARDKYLNILILLTVTGFLLRLYQLGYVSYYIDEAASYYIVHQPVLQLWDFRKSDFDVVNSPFWYTIEHCMLVVGSDEFTMRIVPAVFGTLTIPVFYFIGKEFWNETIGIITATLLTVSPYHVYYSQVARSYAVFLFLFSLALLFFLNALRTDRRSSWLLFGFFSAAAFWLHYFTCIIVFPLFLFAIISCTGRMKGAVPKTRNCLEAAVVFVFLSIPMIFLVIHAVVIRSVSSPPTWGFVGIELIIATFWFFCGYAPISGIFHEIVLFDPVVAVFLLAFIAGIFYLWRIRSDKSYLLLTAMLIPLGMSYVLSFGMPMDPRYLTGLLPCFFLAVSFSGLWLIQSVRNTRIVWCVLVVVVLVCAPPLFTYYSAD